MGWTEEEYEEVERGNHEGTPEDPMNSYRKTGLVVVNLNHWHGPECMCETCSTLEHPFHPLDYRPLILAEAKRRKCKRKSCKRHGCDCSSTGNDDG